jgi:hypothetical protein
VRALLLLVSALAAILCFVPLGLGGYLFVAPSRAGNFLNEAFAVFPAVEDDEGRKRWFYRVLGVGCVLISGYCFRQIWAGLVLPVMRALQ